MPEPAFTWVHLSDVHARHGNAEHQAEQRAMFVELAADLRKLPDGLDRVDAIFVTGDLAFSGGKRDPKEYSDLAAFLAKVQQAVNVPAKRVYFVAGNHDVDRSVADANPALTTMLGSLRSGQLSLMARDANLEPALQLRLAEWRGFAASVAPHLALDDEGAWHVDLEGAGGVPLRLVGLNTALLSQDDADHGNLRIGRRQVDRVMEDSRFVLTLAHHPLSWLADPPKLLGQLRRWNGLYLHGHVHEQSSTAVLHGGGELNVTVVAGAVHLDPRDSQRAVHAYNFGALFAESGKPCRLQLWPRLYDDGNGYIVDARNCLRDKNYAELMLPKTLTWKSRPVVAVPAHADPRPPVMAETTAAFRPPLEVYVVRHPDSEIGRLLATQLYSALSRNVDLPLDASGLGIPVFFRSAPALGAQQPAAIPMDRSDATAIVAIIDQQMLGERGTPYRAYLRALNEVCDNAGPTRSVIPVGVATGTVKIPGLNETHYVRAESFSGGDLVEVVRNGVMHHLVRLLRAGITETVPPPIEVFLSHAKQDGAPMAERIRSWLHDGKGLGSFLDRHDIAPGWQFAKQIDQRLEAPHTVFVVVLTDALPSRTWCREEIAQALANRRPIVIVDAREGTRGENLAFVGRRPVLRWLPDTLEFWRSLLDLILREALRFAYVPRYLQAVERLWRQSAGQTLYVPHTPDLVDVDTGYACLLHPDPALVRGERSLFHKQWPKMSVATPSTLPLVLP